MDTINEDLIAWLRRQPEGKVLRWGSDAFNKDRTWAFGFVDVRIPEACRELNSNWLWTITPTDEPFSDPEDTTEIDLPFDVDIHYVYGLVASRPDGFRHYGFIEQLVLPYGVSLSDAQIKSLHLTLLAGPERTLEFQGGWTTDVISSALKDLADKYANRPDLCFEWSNEVPESTQLETARAILEKLQLNKTPSYNLGDNIMVSEQVMDFLLQDPDRAAKIMEEFKEKVVRPLSLEHEDQ